MQTTCMMILFSLFIALHTQPQTLTAFRQEIRGGNPTIGTAEDGRIFITNNDQVMYYLYLTTAVAPEIREVWIDGKAYAFTLNQIQQPVIIKTGFAFKDAQERWTLAEPGTLPVFRIVIGEMLALKNKRIPQKGVHIVMQDGSILGADLQQLPDALMQ